MNGCARPNATDGRLGATAIDTRVGAVTLRVAEPLTAPTVAVTVVEPVPTEVARPVETMVATAVFVEAQTAEAVRSC